MIQYVGKSEAGFNIWLINNHRKDVVRKDNVPTSSNFDTDGHNFNTYANFILIKQLN